MAETSSSKREGNPGSSVLAQDRQPRQPSPAVSVLPTPAAPLTSPLNTKLLLVDFRSGEAVSRHPEIEAFLRQGWRVRSAVPRLVEAGGTKLFVVLTQDRQTLVNTA